MNYEKWLNKNEIDCILLRCENYSITKITKLMETVK